MYLLLAFTCWQYLSKNNAEDAAEAFLHYIGNGFGIPSHFATGYLVF